MSEIGHSETTVLSDTSETRCLRLTDERLSVRTYEEVPNTCTASKNQFYSIWLSILSSLSMALELGVVAASDDISPNNTSANGERPFSKYLRFPSCTYVLLRQHGHLHHGDVICFGKNKFSINSLKRHPNNLIKCHVNNATTKIILMPADFLNNILAKQCKRGRNPNP